MPDTPSNPHLLSTLLARLRSRESLEIEFKRGRGGLPDDLWPTASAFANTNGGWILVGVREQGDHAVLDDLPDPEQRLQDFHNLLRNPQKISHPVCGADDATIERVGGKPLLVIRVPAASRKHRPVFIGRNPYDGTYLRRNTGDYRCTKQEVDRMMREASDVTADSAVLDAYTLDDLDPDALARYRRRYQTANPGSPWIGYDDLRFLQALGAHRRDRQAGKEGFTVAGLLLFGTREALRDWRGRHLIDYRRLPEDGAAQERWDDRVAWEGHLYGAFEAIYPRLVSDLPVPFRLTSGVRHGESPAHDAMREALVNLLVHADYGETDASLIFRHDQGCRFQNPGNSRVPKDDLLSGDHSDPRNPILMAAFRYVGLADEAGTGIPKILRAWHDLGFRLPDIDVGTERYRFDLRLRHVHLLADEDRAWLTALAGAADEPRQLALVHAKAYGFVDNAQLCTLTGQHSADATKTLTGLRDEDLLAPRGSGRWTSYALSSRTARARISTGPSSGRWTSYALSSRAQSVLDAVRSSADVPSLPDLFDVEVWGTGGNTGHSAGGSTGLKGNAAGYEGSSASLGGSEASLEGSGTRLEGNAPGSEGSVGAGVRMPGGFGGTTSEWAILSSVASPTRERPRVGKDEVGRLVVALCTRAALSLEELTILVGRKRPWVREVVQNRLAAGALRYLYPGAPTSPKQRYIASTREAE